MNQRANPDELAAATTFALLERYVRSIDDARRYADQHPFASSLARENAEAIAAEIERRCVR
ncbi:hypothetical protein CFH99_07960 [Nocardioides aromaticivorans]|uniref:Uncharacterized protein n=1 Tax=Nocardioides aromaticivorans TaxID=200618 RepID=A0ABX7PI43_9ACTN|nr:hypothetical protein [Nocardioides aromaticivorans]QSR25556.1 hypothetical protein CFH99_07960 [Nocardioides aromaticivorans]